MLVDIQSYVTFSKIIHGGILLTMLAGLARRLAIVEPVFANICVQKQFDRFTLRTKAKVDVQWRLFALVHNIGKVHNYRRVN
jgi:hypothetical protein